MVDMLLPEDASDPMKMSAALKALPDTPKPSQRATKIELNGLENVSELVSKLYGERVKKKLGRRAETVQSA